MSHMYGKLRIKITGTREQMLRGLDEIRNAYIDQYCARALEHMAADWGREVNAAVPVKQIQKAKAGVQEFVMDDFWDVASIPMTMLYRMAEKVPELGMRVNFNVANSVSDAKIRMTIEKPAGDSHWYSCSYNWTTDMILDIMLL